MYGLLFVTLMMIGGWFCGGLYGIRLAIGACFFIAAFFLLYIMWNALRVHIDKEVWGSYEKEALEAAEIAMGSDLKPSKFSPPFPPIMSPQMQEIINKRKLH